MKIQVHVVGAKRKQGRQMLLETLPSKCPLYTTDSHSIDDIPCQTEGHCLGGGQNSPLFKSNS